MVSWVAFFFFVLLETALIARSSVGDTEGFISIDCGIPDGYTYKDAETELPYVSDSNYTDTGTNHNISSHIKNSDTTILTQEMTLRSFPQGRRNCYTLPAEKGTKYLVRATFLHGNYDGSSAISADNPVLFDLYLGVNFWQSVNISDPAAVHRKASAITVALADYIFVCLINKGTGTPFISSLELRPIETYMYPNATESVSLVTYERFNYGARSSEQLIRFPEDQYDRLWWPAPAELAPGNLTPIQTTFRVLPHANDIFMVPSAVLQTAVVPDPGADALQLTWKPRDDEEVLPQVHIIMHFAEIQLQPPQSRNFNVYLNDLPQDGSPITPDYLVSSNIHTAYPYNTYRYNISLRKTPTSAFPPILNAIEIYSVLELSENATDAADVDAIGNIKKQYKVNKDWVGDPCAPKEFKWEGLSCSDTSDPPRITTIDLSSSGLTGTIAPFFAELKAVTSLDLSYNNLTGTIPASLAELPSLQVLDLTSNQLSGQIPTALFLKMQNGSLSLRTEGNPDLCANDTSCKVTPKSRKKLTTPVIALLCIVSVIVVLLVTILCSVLRKPRGILNYVKSHYEGGAMPRKYHNDDSLQLENRQFTYMELKNITNNFAKVLGKGGFGTVYHGYLQDNTQVAVKIRSQLSSQGVKEFHAEAQHLIRVHHRNLVSMIGYCKDGDYLGLVYEHMSNGTLQEHLRGKTRNATVLSWGQRLQIAVDAAQGLEYLHNMCWPPLIHRDVKTENILLNERLVAKIADFGLSKAFQSELNSHVSSNVVGTPGYVDPEYYSTFHLSEKSDVYSFGVVLLELITGKPPILEDLGNLHIAQFVRQGLARGNIEDIVDPRLQGEYDVNSAWKCADVALNCTSHGAQQRPTMADVLIQLKESLELATPPPNRADDDDDVSAGSENLFREASFICPNDVHSAGVSTCSCAPSAR